MYAKESTAKVVDTYDLNVISVLSLRTENETSDTAKSVNTYFNHFVNILG